ncbi:MAG: CDP-glycerol:poly(glycerophosphate)glycerophosph otransferase [Acidobacteria bacterium]|nr:CDP-glycerol:poly(glycerophosphate)glycerophosph otransferase [Acidobacteriota bacterium]
MSWAGAQLARLDRAIARLSGRYRVVVDGRTAMNFAILAPVAEQLRRDRRIDIVLTADRPENVAIGGVSAAVRPRRSMEWRRVDLCLSADPWDPIRLRRCRRRANFFHGMAGKYDLDAPGGLPAGFGTFDRVAFVNADRMQRYVDAGVVSREAAVLVGYPKVDALVQGRFDAAAVRSSLGLEAHRRTALYAPTWSPASSLHLAGEAIVHSLVAAGLNVIVKLHDRSLDLSNDKFSGGIDWRGRFAAIRRPGRIAFVETADSSPLLAASDVMVTDHSSIGFEFCLLDRPLLVFDTPDLIRVARINPEKVDLLRSAARVIHAADDAGAAALDELAHRDRRAAARAAIVRDMFHDPGGATGRAVSMVYELLGIPAPRAQAVPISHTTAESLP